MKTQVTSLLVLITVLFSGLLEAQSYCLRLTELANDGTDLTLKIEMNGDAPFRMGSSNLVFITEPGSLSLTGSSVVSSSFSTPSYFEPTLTEPVPGKFSFNIELTVPGMNALLMAETRDWTEIAQINMSIANVAALKNIDWSYSGFTTETIVFLDDEKTLIYATEVDCLEGIVTDACPSDFNNDGLVNIIDLTDFLAAFGFPCDNCPFDLNNDNVITASDLTEFISDYGTYCSPTQDAISTDAYKKASSFKEDLLAVNPKNSMSTQEILSYFSLRDANSQFKLYPNPNQGYGVNLLLEHMDKDAAAWITVSDITGKIIAEDVYANGRDNNKLSIDFIHKLSPGTYVIQVQSEGEIMTQKLNVQ